MLSHITVGVTDFDRAFTFYSAIMEVLGYPLRIADETFPMGCWKPANAARPLFMIVKPEDCQLQIVGAGQLTAFLAPSRKAVDRCYKTAIANGGKNERPPTLGPHHPHFYGAYFFDPDGNKLCVCCHQPD